VVWLPIWVYIYIYLQTGMEQYEATEMFKIMKFFSGLKNVKTFEYFLLSFQKY
jgi:hypothetical protein